jgi:HAD superfamily hydrolase (TIGR01490 family)
VNQALRPMDLAESYRLAGEAAAAVADVESALEVPPDQYAGAFFDVDNTIMRGASIFHFARGLAARKFFTFRDLSDFAWKQARFALGAEDMGDMASATEAALSFVAGRRVEELQSLAEEIFDDVMATKLWPGTLALAQGHLDAGQRVWLVTATPVELATIMARRLGLTGALGTVSEIEDGVYTGRLVGQPLHGPAKVEAVRALAAREGLDLSRCAAYSDSSNDIPMLSLVGNPCAVNPDSDLRAYAREQGWTVRDYRRKRMATHVGIPVGVVTGAAVGVGVGMTVAAIKKRHR